MEERILKWHNYFSRLLSSEPPAVDELIDEYIERIICDMNIEKVFEILKAYDKPLKLLKAIETTYTNTKAKVITSDGILVILISKQESYKAIRFLLIYLKLYLTKS